MAQSPSHRFGQLIGDFLESVIYSQLEDFCNEQRLYLDYSKRQRSARRGKKVSWSDHYGNIHDLDFVIERDGTDDQIGTPIAFIESAWRRYTKHSRNKAQEIQGAILPLVEKHRWNNPFLGTILAGEFTEASLEQLRSHGFQVLYFPYDSLVDAFASQNLIISFDEQTPDHVFEGMIQAISQASSGRLDSVWEVLKQTHADSITEFFAALKERLARQIARITIIPLYGKINTFFTVEQALSFLDSHMIYEGSGTFRRYEILVSFSNGDKVEASFEAKSRVKSFLEFVVHQ